MKKLKNSFFGLLVLPLVFLSSGVCAQGNIMSFEDFKTLINETHPVIQQANLILANAKQNVRLERAGFDPYLSYYKSQKTFTGKEYYNYENIDINIPTWLGVDLSAGYENNAGQFTNDEITLGNSYYVGGSVSLTKGLYMNERRAALQQAQILQRASIQERQNVVNDLLYDAYISYFNWLKEYLKYLTYENIYNLNQTRYDLVVNTWKLGKAPAIDTIEARSQLQQFELLRNNTYIKWLEEGIKLSKHIWDSTTYRNLVQGNIAPDSNSIQVLNVLDSTRNFWYAQVDNHPSVVINNAKQEMIGIKQRLYIQDLLPEVGVSAYRLQNEWNNLFINDVGDNNRFGINIGVPLRFSKGRANYQLNKNELLGTQLKQDFMVRKIQNDVLFQLQEISITKSQLGLYNKYVENLSKLFQAENTKYQLGSSTIFLINSRENKLLDVKLKRIENAIKYQHAIIQLYDVVAQLNLL